MKRDTLVLGHDPGVGGATVFLHADGTYEGHTSGKDTLEEQWNIMCEAEADIGFGFGVIEKVHSMPRQGVKSTFTFGQAFGRFEGLIMAFGLRYEEVTPAVWQRGMKCLTKGDKNVTKAAAERLFRNQVRVTHRIADALLIAEYARRLAVERGLI